jgi:hypothetical protein
MLLESTHNIFRFHRKGHNSLAMALRRATHFSTVTVTESARRC